MAIHVTRAGVALTVGIILVTGLIIGGLFWAKNQGEQARRDEAITIAEENLEEQSGEEVALNEAEKKQNEENQGASSGNTTGNTTTDTESTNNPATVPSTGVEELPQTGPADALSFIGLGLVVFSAVVYYRSRRSLLEAV